MVGGALMQLSACEIEEVAEEAGISPVELRRALAQEHSRLPRELRADQGSLLPPPEEGTSVHHVEAVLPQSPVDAAAHVKRSIEEQIGVLGRLQRGTELVVIDERGGVVYRIRAKTDERGGALVRVDIDPGPSRGRLTLAAAALVAATTFFIGTAGLLSSLPFLMAGAAVAIFGGLAVAAVGRMRRATYRDASARSARALLESEDAFVGLSSRQ